MATTYNNLYLDTRARLKKAGVEAAQLEAREILCFATGKTKEQLVRDMPLYASGDLEGQVEALIRRRLAGEPVAYIVGEWEFYGLPLDISSDVLIPRADTEVLAERGILKGQGPRARGPGCWTCAPAAAVWAGHRRSRPPVPGGAGRAVRGGPAGVQTERAPQRPQRPGDLPVGGRYGAAGLRLWDFDVLVCNPPYIPTGDIQGLDISVRDYEPLMALDGGEDGLDFYRFIAAKWKSAIRLGGSLIFEVGIGQSQDVEEILAQNGFEQIQTTADTQGIWRWWRGPSINKEAVYALCAQILEKSPLWDRQSGKLYKIEQNRRPQGGPESKE